MTTFRRTVYDNAPDVIEVPPELRQHRVEVIIIALEEEPVLPIDAPETAESVSRPFDDRGWPVGFFEATSGQWQGTPLVRDQPTSYELREDLD
ncbi:MAG: hypothetical protein M9936_17910 [Caldilinea sp.]|nr:hypothetical protein [Caldilinea sp.]MCB0066362.1 hypothetical protein [Caldilineaceae bacterium]MCB0040156.1 hypothetical protein [Caldilinea sp.]MCB0048291.1 hypothetical protein [Caldilinea sp.]MCB0137872.1 hypothetical protein [Caldilineaceae bacterium]